MNKTRVFQCIAICIPFAFFALLELGLRAVDYGQEIPLFMDYPNNQSTDAPQYLLPSADVIKRYFPEASKPPPVSIETNFFLKNKPKDGLRIFVQGGSTAAGFPFGYGASLAGMLDYRLKQSFPDKTVEVVNTALSAVNSYTILDFVDEIIAQQPDAVLIYAGHNEYLGILGVGSAYTAANSSTATLLYLKLKDLRIFQLLQNLYWQSVQPPEQGNNHKSRTFMAKVAKHKNIAYGSDLYQAGLQQFQRNMTLVLNKYKAAGIPVFISSIASNLADQAPFSSESAQSVSETSATNADVFYRQGRKLIAEGEYEKAKQALTKARDYDLLRFRAPSAINNIISELLRAQSVYFVDANQNLVDSAKDNIIGNDLMLEHLHPTIDGYFIIADSFYKALQKSELFGRFPQYIDTEVAQQDLPVFDAEIYWGKAKVASLMADYPFTKSPQKVQLPVVKTSSDRMGLAAYQKQIDWLTIAQENLGHGKRHDQALYVKSAKLLADAMPFDANHNYRAGTVLIKQKAFSQARRYLLRAIAINKSNINYQLALSHSLLEQGKLKQALPWLESVSRIAPNNATVVDVLPKVKAHLANMN
jgi:tetratricopeptide (TPR) repeat protein